MTIATPATTSREPQRAHAHPSTGLHSNAAAWAPMVLRTAIGLVFVMHGGQKLFVYGISGVSGSMEQLGLPLPYLSAIMATGAELFGGVALIVGVATRLAALILAFTMLVATVTAHLGGGFFLPEGFEYTLTLMLASVSILLSGAGRCSVDRWWASRRS